MPSGRLWGVLVLSLLSVGAWGQEETEDAGDSPETPKTYKVSISGTTIELTCPENPESETIRWEQNDKVIRGQSDVTLALENFSEVEHSGYYSCYTASSKNNRKYLYLRARVCKNCVEVTLGAVAAVIVVDVLVTLGLLLLVYHWSKSQKGKAKPVSRGGGGAGRPGGQSKERPPPVPNPDYEPIRKGQRELYSGLNPRGT